MSPKQSLLPSQPGPPNPRHAATGRVCRAVPEPCQSHGSSSQPCFMPFRPSPGTRQPRALMSQGCPPSWYPAPLPPGSLTLLAVRHSTAGQKPQQPGEGREEAWPPGSLWGPGASFPTIREHTPGTGGSSAPGTTLTQPLEGGCHGSCSGVNQPKHPLTLHLLAGPCTEDTS